MAPASAAKTTSPTAAREFTTMTQSVRRKSHRSGEYSVTMNKSAIQYPSLRWEDGVLSKKNTSMRRRSFYCFKDQVPLTKLNINEKVMFAESFAII